MTELTTIQSKIHEIRGRRVMLDFDLAAIYGIETAQLKRAVRRHIERFEGEDFMFEPTMQELSRCQIGILNKNRGGNIKYQPFAFTELGVAMLSSVLNSPLAIEINRNIMRAFVAMRQLILSSTEIREIRTKLRLLERNDDQMQGDINNLYAAIEELSIKPSPPRNPLGFDIPQE